MVKGNDNMKNTITIGNTHQKIIDAIVQKAEAVCPNSLALIGIYGSVATGDIHEKSDIDLMILINDDCGWQLSNGFILDDAGVGYDIYCTNWAGLEWDADCNHAHLSKLLDSKIVYVKDEQAVDRLEELKKKAKALLESEERYEKAMEAFNRAKASYSECFLSNSMSQVRTYVAETIGYLLDAIMLFNGRYWRKGVKRTFEELQPLQLPFDMETAVLQIIRAENVNEIRSHLTALMKEAKAYLIRPKRKAEPTQDNLRGTYEEMYSNWRNKMWEAAKYEDLYSSFMNMASLQTMLNEIAENVAIDDLQVMDKFNPHQLEGNAEIFDSALGEYLQEYQRIGIEAKHFANVDDFVKAYLEK